MSKSLADKASQTLFIVALAYSIYMPLHVFIVQSASLLTGGLEIWKAAKDVLLVVLVPLLLLLAYRRGLFQDKTFRLLMAFGALYTLLHLLYVLFDTNDDTYSAIVASVYNTRLLGYLLLGYVVGAAANGTRYLRNLLTAAVLIATLVAVFGVAQYFLPPDLLSNVGYSEDRGVKALFFIDDRPELPRVMSTVKDPNSFGAYLIVPMLLCAYAYFSKAAHKKLFARQFRQGTLLTMAVIQSIALFLTFSRGALIALGLSTVTLLYIVTGERGVWWLRRFWYVLIVLLSIIIILFIAFRESALIQDYVFHAAVSTTEADPNEKRLILYEQAIDDITEQPEGYGPGTAGLVSITNPQGGLLTENYYLQIAYEVGWLGFAMFIAILAVIIHRLARLARSEPAAAVLLSALIGYIFYSLLIHLWSNETLALQWWLLTGVVLGSSIAVSHKN